MAFVIFDFDGTIYRGETLRLFLKVLATYPSRRKRVQWFYLTHAPGFILYKLGIARHAMMRLAMRGLAQIMKGMNQQELQQLYSEVYSKAEAKFCPKVLARLSEHLKAGDRVVLLSGAIDGFVALTAARLGVAEWIGSKLSVEHGVSTGKMGSILMSEKKVQAIQEHIKAQPEIKLKEAIAYADGLRDLPLLELVGHPIAANPEPELAQIAKNRGWEIIYS